MGKDRTVPRKFNLPPGRHSRKAKRRQVTQVQVANHERNINVDRIVQNLRKNFVGCKILHKWVLNEETKEVKWYHGEIMSVLKGRDGVRKAVYEVIYSEEDSPCQLSREEVIEDLLDDSLKFI